MREMKGKALSRSGNATQKTTVEYQQIAAKPMMPFVTICRARIRRYGT